MPDTTGYGEPNRDEGPIPDIWRLADVGPVEGIEIIDIPPPGDDTPVSDHQPLQPRVDRPVVASALTVTGVAGTVVATALPWSGGRDLPDIRALATVAPWVFWLLVSVLAAVVLGLLALARPGRRSRWLGAAAALVGAALSAVAINGLPVNERIGIGPGLACVALVVLGGGQVVAALARAQQPTWRWRPAGIAALVVVVLLAGAGLGSAGLADATDVDATTTDASLAALHGAAPSVVDRKLWASGGQTVDVAGSVALLIGSSVRGPIQLNGIGVLDLRTGARRWHHYERGWTVREAALTEDGSTAIAVVDTGDDTEALGFDAATGILRWRQRLASAVNCVTPGQDQITPVGACVGQLITGDGVLFMGPTAHDGTTPITYLDARDGREWPIRLGPGCRVRGAGGDDNDLYVMDQCVTAGFPDPHLLSETVIAYTLAGTRRWSTPLALVRGSVAVDYGPVFVRDDVVLAQQEQRYVALAVGDGTLLWTTTDGFEPETTVTDGSRLAWSTGVQVAMLDLHSGTMLWQQNWRFPEEADQPLLAGGRLYLIRHTIGPNPYTCARQAALLTIDPSTGDRTGATPLPDNAGNDCGPDVEDRSYLRGPLLVLVTADTITVLAGH